MTKQSSITERLPRTKNRRPSTRVLANLVVLIVATEHHTCGHTDTHGLEKNTQRIVTGTVEKQWGVDVNGVQFLFMVLNMPVE